MTESEVKEVAGLTAKCSQIAKALEEGQAIAVNITGDIGIGNEEKAAKGANDQLGNLRCLVDDIAWRTGSLVKQLNRIQNQL